MKQHEYEPLTQLLNMALEFAADTRNAASYYTLVAAGKLAYNDHLKWQVINTARFIGTNPFFIEMLELGLDRFPADFVVLADEVAREEIATKAIVDEWEANNDMQELHEWAREMSFLLPEADEERIQIQTHQRRYNAAYAAALACRTHRPRDDE